MNILLIDDEASKGWSEIIGKILEKFGDNDFSVAENSVDAEDWLLKKEYDLIFLDIRLDDVDHKEKNIQSLTSYKLLKEKIREIDSKNFTTPLCKTFGRYQEEY